MDVNASSSLRLKSEGPIDENTGSAPKFVMDEHPNDENALKYRGFRVKKETRLNTGDYVFDFCQSLDDGGEH
jgi:hypothetical protein